MAVVILFVAESVVLTTVLFSKTGDDAPMIFRVLIVMVPWFILMIAYLFSVMGLSINGQHLCIERPIGIKKYSIKEIAEATPIDKREMKGTIRGFGNGGIFGYYGKFFNSKFGSMTWYVTRRDRLILLRMIDNSVILISPDDLTLAEQLKKSKASL